MSADSSSCGLDKAGSLKTVILDKPKKLQQARTSCPPHPPPPSSNYDFLNYSSHTLVSVTPTGSVITVVWICTVRCFSPSFILLESDNVRNHKFKIVARFFPEELSISYSRKTRLLMLHNSYA